MQKESRIRDLMMAIDGLEGIPIPYNIIKNHIEPLRKWCIQMLGEEQNNGKTLL